MRELVKKSDRTLGEIEKIQGLLRESIAESKRLAHQSDMLIKQHRRQREAESDDGGR